MVNTRALQNNFSCGSIPYTSISGTMPCGLLSLAGAFFPKDLSTDGSGSTMSNCLDMKVIGFSSELIRSQKQNYRKGVPGCTQRPQCVHLRGKRLQSLICEYGEWRDWVLIS